MDKRNRPLLRPSRSLLETALEIAAVVGFIYLLYGLSPQTWRTLPDRIPTHFGMTGKPDAWGNKTALLTLPGLGIILYASLTVLSFFPHIYNYPWPITEANAERQYRMSRTLVASMKATALWLFVYLLHQQIRVAKGQAQGMSVGPLLLLVGLIPAALGVYLWQASKAR